ncbi:MAG TPA: 4-(cytidine 5'-diphospho)-2-C-methyl-D-erythritol kinase [Gammaproteobacteria bacterium]|nr:4-(cytidine 5'-diphospho)-2-C-methyl-D-erythritol kinase [Gammaproteobacteria bacterium]
MSTSLHWPAPAKINLFLHVLGRRSDGYHELQTVFQFLDCCDLLDFERRDDGEILLVTPLPGITAEQNLAVRAARLLKTHTGIDAGVTLHLDKRLPVGGGIGGGSSDAATALVALNHLWDLHLADQELAQLGVELGADVPIFLYGRAAFAEGVGERLTPVEPPESWVVLIKPECSVTTAMVFADPDLTRHTSPITIRAFLEGTAVGNDCETVVRRHFPPVAAALDWLAERGPARLTGTGSCVYAAYASEARARAVGMQVPAPWRGYVVRALNRSPLLDRLEHAQANVQMSMDWRWKL